MLRRILGMQLETHQTGPQGQKVRRLLVEEGADIRKELYVGMVVDRVSQRVVLMASSEGGMDIEEVAAKTPEKIRKVSIDPAQGLADADADEIALGIGIPEASLPQGRALFKALYKCFDETDASLAEINPLILDCEESGHRARREAQLRRQRAVPPSRARRPARPRRGGPARDRGLQARPQLHLARRQHRLHGERRRPRHGDHGHHQALRRSAGELPRRGRRRHRGEGDRGVQDHAVQHAR